MSHPIRCKYDKDVITAWAASGPAQRRRWGNAAIVLTVFAAVLLLGVWFGHFSGPFCTFLFFATCVVTSLCINAMRRCPACGEVPNGSAARMHFIPLDACLHCNHWLVRPYGMARDPEELT